MSETAKQVKLPFRKRPRIATMNSQPPPNSVVRTKCAVCTPFPELGSNETKPQVDTTNEDTTTEMTHTSLLEAEKQQEEVYLMTANVKLYKPDAEENKGIPATVLFDSGSQRTFVSENVVRSLELNPCLRQVLSLNTGPICSDDLKNSGHGCVSAPVKATRGTFEEQAKKSQTPRNPEKFWSLESVVITDIATIRMKRTCKRKVKMWRRTRKTRKKKKVDERPVGNSVIAMKERSCQRSLVPHRCKGKKDKPFVEINQ
ncbi:unnamed protein product [Toxocara canis]|uniref:DUF1758 domain-containing protein n=1 Tax=Toxocara canis TaxID=6265 RepID=A0A183UT56_TOXCA|nr:unnamed protein product [Toxocara canis]